ncbi:MAG: hypothetical protein R3C49_10470 [Planctomycetaceae bacterium]
MSSSLSTKLSTAQAIQTGLWNSGHLPHSRTSINQITNTLWENFYGYLE